MLEKSFAACTGSQLTGKRPGLKTFVDEARDFQQSLLRRGDAQRFVVNGQDYTVEGMLGESLAQVYLVHNREGICRRHR